MKWNFNGFENWPASHGVLDLIHGFDVFRACESRNLPRDVCEGCVCWREFGSCTQVQVNDFEDDAIMRESHIAQFPGAEPLPVDCLVDRNCCPILFFDFIGRPLPVLDTEANNAVRGAAEPRTLDGLVGDSGSPNPG